jgi:YD repeat-containing protein
MYSRVAHRSTLRIVLALGVCAVLLSLSSVPLPRTGVAQGQRDESKGKPKLSKPEGVLPDFDEIKQESGVERLAPPPVPSTMRSRKNSGKPWDGRRVGDPEPHGTDRGSAGSAFNHKRFTNNQTRRAHARSRMTAPPPVPDDQFVQNFFTWCLARTPSGDETTYWYNQLRVAYGRGQTSLKLAALELGRTLFESADYAARNRTDHWYVYDLYKTYLMRDPDSGGWAMWESVVSTHGREYVRRGFEESGELATLIANMTLNGSPTSGASSLISARVDGRNQPGRGILSRDASWNVPLLSLPGRAGLDLGLALSYSSQIWTRSGPYLYFDEDIGFPSPGFRLGFPTVQRKVFDVQTAKNTYLLITASGNRVELRHVSSNIYDAADSSYLRLIEDVGLLRVYSTDGTRLTLIEANGQYRCTEVKDRNGNYISVTYNALGHIATVTETLGRVITFNYDGNANLLSITQSWAGQPSHQWVGFSWSTRSMQSTFSSAEIVGTNVGASLPVIVQVSLNDTSYFTFEYTNALQISAIRNYFGATERNATLFTYGTSTGDTPRLSDKRLSARNWTGYNNVPSQVITTYSVAGDGSWCSTTGPDGTIYKDFYGTGWQKGLTTLSEVWSGGSKVKWTTITWTQDNTGVSYETNPRVTETNIYDSSGNRRRTTIDYGIYAQWGLPYSIVDYAADGVTPIRNTITDYNLSQVYLDRRIIGLVAVIHQTDIVSWQRKVGFIYDDPGRLQALPAGATQHDSSYNTSFTVRGNLTGVSRYDVEDIVNPAKVLTSYTNYFTTGTPASNTDASGHLSIASYTDSFSDSINRNTFAYPTTTIDPDNNSYTVQYNFDHGSPTRTQSPTPAGQSQGAIQTTTYNSLGQLERITTTNNGAYKRFWYGADFTASYATVNSIADELYSIQVTDGMGRVIGTVNNHPGSTGGFRLVNTIYNLMGREWLISNPTEVNSSWGLAGADVGGIYYTQQTYDWQGRPLVTTHPDLTTKEINYGGCGCAGSTVVTVTDEGTVSGGVTKRRQNKTYFDVLGRTRKIEVMNWDGTGPNGTGPNNTVYSTTVNTYNARDQLTQVQEYAGAEGSGTNQTSTMTYDGYGRLKMKHGPAQQGGTFTTWTYHADDRINSVTDARGAVSTYGYAGTNRHLVKTVTHTLAGKPTINISYDYDAVGNRTSMVDGVGTTTYNYNALSRITSEVRYINDLGTNYTLSYDYNLAGELKKITDPFGGPVTYTYDVAGQLKIVNGPNPQNPQFPTYDYIRDIKYRAWGDYSKIQYGENLDLDLEFNSRLQISKFKVAGWVDEHLGQGASFVLMMQSLYEYYADGRIKYVRGAEGGGPTHTFTYDQSSRVKTGNQYLEYAQTYGYDAFDNLTSRTGSYFGQSHSAYSATYTNNRNGAWSYDFQGNMVNDGQRQYGYDAANRPTTVTGVNVTHHPDGDNRLAKVVLNGVVTHYVRSTVLKDQIIAELNFQGTRKARYVYANGRALAELVPGPAGEEIYWIHENPVTSERMVNAWCGIQVRFLTVDPLGNALTNNNYGNTCMSTEPDPNPALMQTNWDLMYGDSSNTATGCYINGIERSCSDASHILNIGSGVELPAGASANRLQLVANGKGFGLAILYPFGDGLRAQVIMGDAQKLDVELPTRFNVEPGTQGSRHIINDRILESVIGDCIKELYPMFEMTGFKVVRSPTANANNDAFNGVVNLKTSDGRSFPVVSDPTPPQYMIDIMKQSNSRGATAKFGTPTGDNPFWTYNCPTCDRSDGDRYGRPAEARYPELYRNLISYVRVQFHELGAALTLIRDKYFPVVPPQAPYPERLNHNNLYKTPHGDDGPAMEDCIGRKYFNLAGLQPRSD